MGSLDSNDSYRPFPIMNQKGVVAGELSQGQVGDIRLQQDTYVPVVYVVHVITVLLLGSSI
jgi:hypothetical protein